MEMNTVKQAILERQKDCSNTDLHGLELNGLSWTRCKLQGANLSRTKFTSVDMSWSQIASVYGEGLEWKWVNLMGASLNVAKFSHATFSHVSFERASAPNAKFERCVFLACNFREADMTGTAFRNCSFDQPIFADTRLDHVDFSGSVGLLDQKRWLQDHFKISPDGKLIVYKAFGQTSFIQPWKLHTLCGGLTITEVVNPNLTELCGCGVNFGTLEYILRMYRDSYVEIWECTIDPYEQIVVPYNSDGKARCAALTLVRRVGAIRDGMYSRDLC